MALFDPFIGNVGNVTITTTSNRGMTPEEVADIALSKIIAVSDSAHPVLADQAHAFQADIRKVLVFYMREAVKAHNVTLVAKFRKAGHPELIKILDS
jgi:hypothetical protein